KAVFEIQDKYYVYVVEDNRARMKSFVPNNRIFDSYIVESGLKPGEMVVYEGLQKLRDSMMIIPKHIVLDSLSKATTLNFNKQPGE
ncbi:MAG TPA: efflux transporter periplasmic adaptor subunit, partial [Cytophagaceae bacterium]